MTNLNIEVQHEPKTIWYFEQLKKSFKDNYGLEVRAWREGFELIVEDLDPELQKMFTKREYKSIDDLHAVSAMLDTLNLAMILADGTGVKDMFRRFKDETEKNEMMKKLKEPPDSVKTGDVMWASANTGSIMYDGNNNVNIVSGDSYRFYDGDGQKAVEVKIDTDYLK